ncbi:MAG: putative heme transporter [Acidimicrobiaceae bacterium]|jgi:uncharacterized protein (TIRG00374 family)
MQDCLDERDVITSSSRRMRIAVLATGAISLILLSPVIGEVYSSLGRAAGANPVWVIVALAAIAGGFVSSWVLQKLTLRVKRLSDVAGPQLAGNAASNLLPMGSAFGSVIQLRMLTRNRVDLTRAITSLTIAAMLSTLTGLLVFPLLLLLPIGDASDTGVDTVARFGVIALIVCIPLVVLTLRSERPMKAVADTVHNTLRRIPRCHPPNDLADRIIAERDGVREVIRQHKLVVALTSVGRTLSDYIALYAALLAVGLRPSPAMVLVAFIAANAAGMVPFTPGGLGFVEAGLSGALVLMGAQEEQTLAAVAIYRLVSCWLPVLAGVIAYVVSRRSATVAPVIRTRSVPVVENTCLGVPAAAQTAS